MWYEGPDLRGTSQLVGRGVTLKTIRDTVKEGTTSLPRFIALTGIGGIGYDSYTCHGYHPIGVTTLALRGSMLTQEQENRDPA